MANEQGAPGAPAPGAGNRKRLIIIPVVLVVAIAAFAYWLSTRGRVTTDDAQIEGHLVPVNARVNGYVRSILVRDNQHVGAGRLLVQLDRRDLEAKVRMLEADLASARAQSAAASGQVSLVERTAPSGERQAGAVVSAAQAGVGAATKGISSAQAQAGSAEAGAQAAQDAVEGSQGELEAAKAMVRSAEAGVNQAEANATSADAQAKKAASDESRYRELFTSGAVPKQQLEAVEATNISAASALKAARSGVDAAKSALAQAKARRATAEAGLKQAKARLASAMDAATQARVGVGLARSALAEARARLTQARAGHAASQTVPQQMAISKSQQRAAAARIKQVAANLEDARLQLSYTRIVSPVDGIVSQKTVQLGQYVQPGQALMAVVPLKRVWVVANFKETEIGRMHRGQRVGMSVDTYPDTELAGRIDSIGAATGAKFSLLPPENATGNFVKVVQRVPVKIVFRGSLPRGIVLRPGLNVVATVYL